NKVLGPIGMFFTALELAKFRDKILGDDESIAVGGGVDIEFATRNFLMFDGFYRRLRAQMAENLLQLKNGGKHALQSPDTGKLTYKLEINVCELDDLLGIDWVLPDDLVTSHTYPVSVTGLRNRLRNLQYSARMQVRCDDCDDAKLIMPDGAVKSLGFDGGSSWELGVSYKFTVGLQSTAAKPMPRGEVFEFDRYVDASAQLLFHDSGSARSVLSFECVK